MRENRYCPKCGSINTNAETTGTEWEPRYHWCMDCGHGRYNAFSLKPPKTLQYENVEERILAIINKKAGQVRHP